MKKELFNFSEAEARAFLEADGVRVLDYVETGDKYRLFGTSIGDTVKLRVYDDKVTFELEITVPDELQCVPCEIKFKTGNKDACPCCGTSIRDVMLRNKTFEEPFRRFESVYSSLLTAGLKIAQPVMMYVADNFTEEQAKVSYDKAVEEYGISKKALEKFEFIFEDGIMDKAKALKEVSGSVVTMKTLMGDDATAKEVEDFKK